MEELLGAILVLVVIIAMAVLIITKVFLKQNGAFFEKYRKEILEKIDELIPDYIYDKPLTDEDVEKIVLECSTFILSLVENSKTIKAYLDKNPSQLTDTIKKIIREEEERLREEMGLSLEDVQKAPENGKG